MRSAWAGQLVAVLMALHLCLVSVAGTAAQATLPGSIRFTTLSVEDGLSQTSVQAVLQDRDGFIWLGTQEGLNRFDGREFEQWFHDAESPDSLAHNWVWTLHEDRQGHLWIGTGGGGLDRLDRVSGRITHFRHDPDDDASIGSDVVRDIVEDHRGHLWIATDGGGIARLDPLSGAVTRLADLPPSAELPDPRVRVLHRDARGSVWVGTDGGGVARLDPTTGTVERVDLGAGAAASRVRAIVSDGAEVWFGTYEGGLLRLDTDSAEITRFTYVPGDSGSLSGNSIRSLFFDESGTLWVGTDGAGLNEFVSDEEGFRRYRHDATEPSSLADDHVVELTQDRGGVIWVGTYRGVSRWNPRVGTFTTVSRHGDDPDQLSDNYVTSLAEGPAGAIWIGTYGGGLNRWDRATGGFRHFVHDPDDASTIGDDRVFALAPGDGALWIGTRGAGLNRMDLDSHEVQRFVPDPSRSDSLSADGVTSILRDSRGTVWIGTFVGGLNRLDDVDSGRFTRFRHDPADAGSLCSDRVLALAEGFDGGIWVGTYGGGVCRLDVASGRFTTWRHDPGDPASLSSDRAWSLHEDAEGNLWIGTQDAGLNLWRVEDRRAGRGTFTRFGRDHGLGSLAVYAAESDSLGRIWFSTNRGLARLEPDTGTLSRYDVTRGLQSNEFNHGAHGRTAAGELMFGGIAGFNIFEPETIRTNDHPPQIAFTGISRLNEPVDFRPALAAGRALEFGHRDVLVSFEYAALDFTVPERNQYRHRLLGFDPQWVEDGGERRATYTNLAAGSYVFEVMAANSDGVWSPQPLRLDFTVLPAPWATWWARTGYALLLLVALALAFRSHARRLAVASQIQRTNEALREEMAQREQQRRALVTAKEQAQRYLDVVEVIILSLDDSGTIRLVNQKGLRTLGYQERELLGRSFYDVVLPAAERDALRERFSALEDHAYSESTIVTRDGSRRLVGWHTVALPQQDDQPPGLLLSGTDLTQERSLEQQVQEAQKLEALGTLSRGIAHDFNNILGAIQGFADMLRRDATAPGKASSHLDDLDLSVERARRLVKSILTFGRQAPQEATPTRLQSVVEEALQLLRPTVPAHVQVASHGDPDTPSVFADPTQLHQVVMNLATNAIQAMDEHGGTLTLSVAPRDVGPHESRGHPDLRAGRYAELLVQDTGPGMDELTYRRMFEPFFTTKGPSRGTGLGLSVVHGIVTQMGGTIAVSSAPGHGTEVRVLLPACDEGRVATRVQAPDDGPVPLGSETVLLVDDEPVLLELERAMLTPLGYRVLISSGGAGALREIESVGHVDLLVTDQNMPGMSGLELARAVRAARPELPVILVTGAYDASLDDPDVDATLEKPFKSGDLARVVRAVLDRRAVRR